MTRRDFLSASGRGIAGAALGTAGWSALSRDRAYGANERVRMALIGCGGRGSYVARAMIEQGAEIVTLCDLLQSRIDDMAKFLSDVQDRAPKQTLLMREVLDDPDVDAVIIATPDQWHAPATVLACQAGKDVYVEKPHAHTIWEGRKMIEAARKYDRIVQIGTQCRSAAYMLAAVEYLKAGKIGDIRLVKVFNLKSGEAFHLGDPGTCPEGFDWDAWLGTAPERPYHRGIFYGGWHHSWDFSGGDLRDDGAHQVDLSLMCMLDPGMPKSVSSAGGRLQYKGDDSEIPDLLVSTFEFDDFVLTIEHSGYPRYMEKTSTTIRRNDLFPYWTQNATRIELYGSQLLMIVGRHGGGWQVMSSGGKIVDQMYGRPADSEHAVNFIECVKAHKPPNAEVEKVHPSCCMLNMANIAHRVGNRKLWFDGKREQFIDDDEANALVKGNPRKKYAIPDKV